MGFSDSTIASAVGNEVVGDIGWTGADSTGGDVMIAISDKWPTTIVPAAGDKIRYVHGFVIATMANTNTLDETKIEYALVDDVGTIKVKQLMAAGNLTANFYRALIVR